MRFCHGLDRVRVTFDDQRCVGSAGLILPATLAQHLGLRDLFDGAVDLGGAPGRAHVGDKTMTVIHAVLDGADCIDDADRLRAQHTATVLGHRVLAPSTLGTFLRSFTWGHVRQLDRVAGDVLQRAWAAGAGPGDQPVTLDIDSTICQTFGGTKQGGVYGYTNVRGYHPLVAVMAGTGEVVHSRLRGGNANTGRGAASFLTDTFGRVRAAGARGPITLRADSGFYSRRVVDTCRRADVRFSITAEVRKPLHDAIAAIDDTAWVPIPTWLDGGADVAETTYRPFRATTDIRVIVRRVRSDDHQLALFDTYRYHAFITDHPGNMVDLEADHRRHAEIENTIRDLKYGVGLNHLPSSRFGANAAWLTLNVVAHNLSRWTARIGLDHPHRTLTHKTMRHRMFTMPGRLTRSGRQPVLHLPAHWPWANQFQQALTNLRAVVLVT